MMPVPQPTKTITDEPEQEDTEGTLLKSMLSKIASKKRKEEELSDALRIQDGINDGMAKMQKEREAFNTVKKDCEARKASATIEMERKLKLKLVEIDAIKSREQARIHTMEAHWNGRLASLQNQRGYRNEVTIAALSEELANIASIATSFQSANEMMEGDSATENAPRDDTTCPICLNRPETVRVFTCDECNNWVCGTCKDQLQNCPQCRTDLNARPMRRNVALERMLRK